MSLVDEALILRPWADRIHDTLGHDPRSWYVETFWLPTLGPTCVLLLRRIADGFDRNPDGFVVATAALSASLGVGEQATTGGPLRRALRRLEQFAMSTTDDDGALLVRRNLPPIHRKHVKRLPPVVRSVHHEWAEAQLLRPLNEVTIARARRTALYLFGEGDSPDTIERALQRTGFSTTVARHAVTWATQRHLAAANAAALSHPLPSPAS